MCHRVDRLTVLIAGPATGARTGGAMTAAAENAGVARGVIAVVGRRLPMYPAANGRVPRSLADQPAQIDTSFCEGFRPVLTRGTCQSHSRVDGTLKIFTVRLQMGPSRAFVHHKDASGSRPNHALTAYYIQIQPDDSRCAAHQLCATAKGILKLEVSKRRQTRRQA